METEAAIAKRKADTAKAQPSPRLRRLGLMLAIVMISAILTTDIRLANGTRADPLQVVSIGASALADLPKSQDFGTSLAGRLAFADGDMLSALTGLRAAQLSAFAATGFRSMVTLPSITQPTPDTARGRSRARLRVINLSGF